MEDSGSGAALRPARPVKTYVVTPQPRRDSTALRPTHKSARAAAAAAAYVPRVLTPAEEKAERLRLSRQKSARNWRNKQKAKLEQAKREQAGIMSSEAKEEAAPSTLPGVTGQPLDSSRFRSIVGPPVVGEDFTAFSLRFLSEMQKPAPQGLAAPIAMVGSPSSVTTVKTENPSTPGSSSMPGISPSTSPIAIPTNFRFQRPAMSAEERRYLKNKRQRDAYARQRALSAAAVTSGHPFQPSYRRHTASHSPEPSAYTTTHRAESGEETRDIIEQPADERLQKVRESSRAKRRREDETPEQREERLKVIRERARERRSNETPEQRERRRAADLLSHTKRRMMRNSEGRCHSLEHSSHSLTGEDDSLSYPDMFSIASHVPAMQMTQPVNHYPPGCSRPSQPRLMLPQMPPGYPSPFLPGFTTNGMPLFSAHPGGFPNFPFIRSAVVPSVQQPLKAASIRMIPVVLPRPPPRPPAPSPMEVDANFSMKIAVALQGMGSCKIVGADANHFPIVMPVSRSNSATPSGDVLEDEDDDDDVDYRSVGNVDGTSDYGDDGEDDRDFQASHESNGVESGESGEGDDDTERYRYSDFRLKRSEIPSAHKQDMKAPDCGSRRKQSRPRKMGLDRADNEPDVIEQVSV